MRLCNLELGSFNHAKFKRSSSKHETQLRNFYHRYMRPLNNYKNIGCRVTTGTDIGFILKTYGFGFLEEVEMLREAGFNPHQAIRAATMNGARKLYKPKGLTEPPIGMVWVGRLADLVIVRENPRQNFKTLYGKGTLPLNKQTQKLERVCGVSYAVKDGTIYHAKRLLADVAAMGAAEKRRMG